MAEQFLHPGRDRKGGEGARLPPFVDRLAAVIDQQTAAVRFELLARPDQLFALPVQGAGLLFRLARHPHHRELFLVPLHVAAQLQAKGAGIAAVGLHPLVAFVQLLRADDQAVDPARSQGPLQAEPETARLVDGVELDAGMFRSQLRRPDQESLFAETLRRLGIAPAFLHHHNVKRLVHIDSQLDRGTAVIKLPAGSLE